jgi:antitoxin PrlF
VATRLTSKGQVTIPKRVRAHLKVAAGDPVEFDIVRGRVEVRKSAADEQVRTSIAELQKRRPGDGLSTDEYMAIIRDEP